MKAEPLRTTECGIAASKRLPLARPSIAEDLLEPGVWHRFVAEYEEACPRRREKIAAYRAVVESGEALRIAEQVAGGDFRPAPPEQAEINKYSPRKKTIYRFAPREELLFKVVNRLLQPQMGAVTSPLCHSFLPERSARTAFRALLRDPHIDDKHCLRLDVRDYFNTIDPAMLLAALPSLLTDDGPLLALLEHTLLDPWVVRDGARLRVERKGVMAGTPLAPILANLYLTDLDDWFAAAGVTYARYSDDIIAFGSAADLAQHDRAIRQHLAERRLAANEGKCRTTAPGEPWEYVGLRYHRGVIDVAGNSQRKLRAKVTRLARRLDRYRLRSGATPTDVTGRFVARINRSLYGVPRDRDEFCWATWFFPVVTTDVTLGALDDVIQQKMRFAATGRHNARARKTLPYRVMQECGYLPLVKAYWTFRDDPESYARLIATRTLR